MNPRSPPLVFAAAARHRFPAALPLTLAMIGLALWPVGSADGQIVSGSATGAITFSVTPGPSTSTGTLAVPPFPGYIDTLGFPSGAFPPGSSGYMAETWFGPVSGGPFGVFIPTSPPSFTPTFVSEGAGFGAPVHMSGTIGATYGVGASGLPASSASLSYPYIWAVGPSASSSVTFSTSVTYTDTAGAWGPGFTLSFSKTKTSSSGGETATAGPITLPALPPGDSISVSGSFDLFAFSAPGDGGALIKTFGVPEPSTFWLLGSVVPALALSARRWRRRWQSTDPSATLSA